MLPRLSIRGPIRPIICLVSLLATLLALASCGLDPMERLDQEISSPSLQTKQEAELALANLPDSRAVKSLVGAL
jgi:hypothetical protein